MLRFLLQHLPQQERFPARLLSRHLLLQLLQLPVPQLCLFPEPLQQQELFQVHQPVRFPLPPSLRLPAPALRFLRQRLPLQERFQVPQSPLLLFPPLLQLPAQALRFRFLPSRFPRQERFPLPLPARFPLPAFLPQPSPNQSPALYLLSRRSQTPRTDRHLPHPLYLQYRRHRSSALPAGLHPPDRSVRCRYPVLQI